MGLERTGRIVTAAAALLAVVFLAIATSSVSFIKLFGIGLTLAVLMDATLIRAALVPAFMRLAGEANWWAPGPLRRIHERWGFSERRARGRRPAPTLDAVRWSGSDSHARRRRRGRRTRAPRGEGDRLRDEILAATEKLLLKTGDESAVSIRAIADAVGVTPPSIYLHFADKDELIYSVCQLQFRKLDEVVSETTAGVDDPLEQLRRRGQAYVRFGVGPPRALPDHAHGQGPTHPGGLRGRAAAGYALVPGPDRERAASAWTSACSPRTTPSGWPPSCGPRCTG